MDLSVLTFARTLPVHVRGGMEEATWYLAKALASLGVRVTILTSAIDHQTRIWTRDGVTVHEVAYVPERLRSAPRYRWWSHFGDGAAAYADRLSLGADVVHTQSFYANGILLRSPRPPVVVTVHGTAAGDYRGGSREKLIQEAGFFHPRRIAQRVAVARATSRERRQLRSASAVVAVSEVVLGMLPKSLPVDRLRTIPNGIDPRLFPAISRAEARDHLALPSDRRILLFLGRVEEYKGVGRLLEALSSFPEAMLVVAGEGPDLEEFRAKVRLHPAKDRVRVLGSVPDSERPFLYAAADVFCLPSQYEGQPVSLLEAMAMGTPVAMAQNWLPGELRGYASVDPDCSRMIEAGLRLADRLKPGQMRTAILSGFTWEHAAREYVRLFRSLLGESS
jgi:glycosyltransferase involved in cell wall biosynthesis